MDNTRSPRKPTSKLRFGDVSPSDAAEHELRWFFNEAEMAVDLPSNYCALLAGMSPLSLEEVERRAEAMHAAAKIKARLEAISVGEAILLAGIYAESPWPRVVRKALGRMAGPLEASALVRAEHLRALVSGRTEAKKVAAWLRELAEQGDPRLASWRRDVEGACAVAVHAYEQVRGAGPSVVPDEEGD